MGLKTFFENTKRVFLVSKKPTKEEYWNLVKITGLGIIILGLIGFILILLIRLFYSPF
jgi:protein transport protein SEC61 subunit gamma-like protein